MNKYSEIKTLKETKARNPHKCDHCGETIKSGDIYYPEKIENKFLHSLHRKKFCSQCYKKYGKKLLKIETEQEQKNQTPNIQQSLENFTDEKT